MTPAEYSLCQIPGARGAGGLGFAVDRSHVATCAHVVNTALGRQDKLDRARPNSSELIGLRFPIGGRPGSDTSRRAKVVTWLPELPGPFEVNDVAVLELTEPIPAHVPILVPRRHQTAMAVHLWGPQPGRSNGGHVFGEIAGEVPGGLIQVFVNGGPFRVQYGFSGAPIWEKGTGHVVGMLSGRGNEPDPADAYMLAMDSVARAWPPWRSADLAARPESFQANATVSTVLDTPLHVLSGHADVVYGVTFSPDSLELATASFDGSAQLWNVATGRPRSLLVSPAKRIYGVTFSPSGMLVATASSDKAVRLWNRVTSKTVNVLHGHASSVLAVAFNPIVESQLATASFDKTACLWDAANSKRQHVLAHEDAVYSVAFSNDGSLLATASMDQTVKLWETSTGRLVRILPDHQRAVFGVAFSPDGVTLASASRDGTARIWEIASGRTVSVLTGHADDVRAVTYAAEGGLLATASLDMTVRLWSAPAGDLVSVVRVGSEVYGVALAANGGLLATASADGMTRLWTCPARHRN